jgi:hypothetical protein
MVQPVNTSGKNTAKQELFDNFPFELTAWRLFSLDHPPSPISLVDQTKKAFHFKKQFYPPNFLHATSYKSFIDKKRFQQNGPASQHIRKESAKNKFLVDFCFELTA